MPIQMIITAAFALAVTTGWLLRRYLDYRRKYLEQTQMLLWILEDSRPEISWLEEVPYSEIRERVEAGRELWLSKQAYKPDFILYEKFRLNSLGLSLYYHHDHVELYGLGATAEKRPTFPYSKEGVRHLMGIVQEKEQEKEEKVV